MYAKLQTRRGTMFNRKRREKAPSDKELDHMIALSENQKIESRKELSFAREVVDVLNEIRRENHIIKDLRKVFGEN